MDANCTTPHWIIRARNIIEDSQEWKAFTAELFEAVQQQLTESHVSLFTDLSEAEKTLFLERAAKAVHRGTAYKDIIIHISSTLDYMLSSYVAKETNDCGPICTKSDLFQTHVRDGMVSLLLKWPDMKSKLHALFNHPLPSEVRKVAWRLFLSNTKAQMDYLSLMSVNKAKSRSDLDISQQCQTLLSKQPTFKSLQDSALAGKVMKNTLSYYHRYRRFKTALPDSESLLLIPLTQAAVAGSTPSTSVDSITALLVEEYITFMDSRLAFMRPQSTGAQADAENGSVFAEVAQMLLQKDKELSSVIQKIHAQQGGNPQESLIRGVRSILQPVLRVMFVGFLNMTTLLYIWDQYIIGLDRPSYNCIPAFSCAFMLLLRDRLLACGTQAELAEVTRGQGPALAVRQFQNVISKYFYGELYSQLTKDEAESFPTLDPTQAFFPPWTHLSTNDVPLRTRPQDRRLAREEREVLRAKQTERLKQEQQLQKLREEEEIRREEERLQRQLEETQRISNEQRFLLEEQLAQERQHRYEIQRKAEEQVKLLQAEIAKIKEKQIFSDVYTIRSFGTPPPSTESKSPFQEDQPLGRHPHTPASARQEGLTGASVNGRTAETVAADLLQRIKQTIDTAINGQHMEREELDSLTRSQLQSYREAVRNAELEVCGRYLDAEEMDLMKEPLKSHLKSRLAAATRRRVEARYRAQLGQGRRPRSPAMGL
ncbi:uncharacterized protein LOC136717661 [Amia ocellicauda]|uniref:uncharacterized protein LOC136717661 n=1 Tax=Amia ocellicauda TaxID=2972642 RepID=UPI0034646A32